MWVSSTGGPPNCGPDFHATTHSVALQENGEGGNKVNPKTVDVHRKLSRLAACGMGSNEL